MALNSSGPISLAGTTAGVSIQVELGGTGTTQISLNDASVRTLAGVATGAITMPTNFYGKSNRVTSALTISANTQNYVLNTAKVTGYVAGKTDVTLTINASVVVGSASTGSYAFTVNTSWAAGDTVTVINNGTVIGAGGDGGAGDNLNTGAGGFPGLGGGPAVSVLRTTSWTNTSGVCGGGGGGGGGGGLYYGVKYTYEGAGGGGGQGNNGGAGGAGTTDGAAGGGGGTTAAGAGGGGFCPGGSGGSLGSTGIAGVSSYTAGGAGGAGGACLSGKSFVNGGAGITGGTTGGGQS